VLVVVGSCSPRMGVEEREDPEHIVPNMLSKSPPARVQRGMSRQLLYTDPNLSFPNMFQRFELSTVP